MDRHEQSELISAYLDGEVTAAERAEVERLLESSPELRAELNDFARLSDLVRALPRESAPAELADAIRRQAEQKSLLGPGPAPAQPKRSLKREWLAALAGVAVTAAAWMITVQSLEPYRSLTPTPQRAIVGLSSEAHFYQDERGGAVLAENEAVPKLETYRERQQLADTNERRGVAIDGVKESSPKFRTPMSPPEGLSSAPAATAAAVPAKKPGFGAALGRGVGGGGGGLMPEALAEFEKPGNSLHVGVRVGDLISYLGATEEAAVFEVTVVDFDHAGPQLEDFLQRNGLQVISEGANQRAANRSEMKKNAAEKASPASGDAKNLLVMYVVDAPRDTIAQVLEGLVQEHVVSQVKLQPPVDGTQVAFGYAALDAAPLSDRPAAAKDKDGEQSPVEEAVGAAQIVAQNYALRQIVTNNTAPAEQTASRSAGLRKSHPDQDASVKRDFAEQRRGVVAKGGTQRRTREPVLKRLDDDVPADAFAASVAGRQLQLNNRGGFNTAIPVQIDATTGQLANDNLGRQSVTTAPAAGDKQTLSSKAKTREEAKDAKAESDAAVAAGLDDPLPEPTIRVLLVLQRAEAAEQP